LKRTYEELVAERQLDPRRPGCTERMLFETPWDIRQRERAHGKAHGIGGIGTWRLARDRVAPRV